MATLTLKARKPVAQDIGHGPLVSHLIELVERRGLKQSSLGIQEFFSFSSMMRKFRVAAVKQNNHFLDIMVYRLGHNCNGNRVRNISLCYSITRKCPGENFAVRKESPDRDWHSAVMAEPIFTTELVLYNTDY